VNVLAKLGPALGFGSFASAVILAAAALVGWWLLRKRRARESTLVLALGVVLIVGCFVPPPAWEPRDRIEGRFGGTVAFDVGGSPRATVTDGGTATVGDARVALACPARCNFTLANARLAEPDNPVVVVEGGPLVLRSVLEQCASQPITLRVLAAPRCAECRAQEYVVGERAHGSMRLAPGPATAC
jgi:hypothetical protein